MAARFPDLARALAAAVVAVALIAGSAFVWIGVPVLGLWTAGELTTSSEDFLLLVLGGVPLTMVAFGWLLYRLNGVYENLRRDATSTTHAQSSWLVSSSDERRRLRVKQARRPLIDVAMSASVVAALVLLAIWFFFIADMSLVINR
jgi:hypothetical protein